MLVHGEKARMNILRENILKEFNIPVYMPYNGCLLSIPCDDQISIEFEKKLLQEKIDLLQSKQETRL